jgi:triacylglycerol lipase
MPNAHDEVPGDVRQHCVLLVHGVLGQSLVYWNLMKRYLTTDRFHVHELRLPFFGFGDLRKAAAVLGQEVDAILADHPEETSDGRIDIIAHSAGGLVARHFIRFLGGAGKVHDLVTLGTPHHGTIASVFFPVTKVGRQTRPGSRFLNELNEGQEAWGPVEYTSVWSVTDGVVVPAGSCKLEGAENVRVDYMTHWGYLWRPRVYEVIRDALDHDEPPAPAKASAPTTSSDGKPRKRAARKSASRGGKKRSSA